MTINVFERIKYTYSQADYDQEYWTNEIDTAYSIFFRDG